MNGRWSQPCCNCCNDVDLYLISNALYCCFLQLQHVGVFRPDCQQVVTLQKPGFAINGLLPFGTIRYWIFILSSLSTKPAWCKVQRDTCSGPGSGKFHDPLDWSWVFWLGVRKIDSKSILCFIKFEHRRTLKKCALFKFYFLSEKWMSKN
jgi:hypothetical protein